jgi:hypothetical protein
MTLTTAILPHETWFLAVAGVAAPGRVDLAPGHENSGILKLFLSKMTFSYHSNLI